MSQLVAFLGSPREAALARQYYGDADVVRVGLDVLSRLGRLPEGSCVWIDGAVDGLDAAPRTVTIDGEETSGRTWDQYIMQFPGWDKICDPKFQEKPDKGVVEAFVGAVLGACLKAEPKPKWLSIPQLPAVTGNGRNKICKALADATSTWRTGSATRFHGKFILPIVLRHQDQTNLKTQRTRKVELALQCYERAGADGYWVVESSLSDQSGAGTFEKRRFPGLIQFHEELREKMPAEAICIAGPYWGMNLVLWARGLVTYPAVGVGGRYQYHVPGGQAKSAKIRVALPPLRRWAIWGPKLQEWLSGIPKDDPALTELRGLLRDFRRFSGEDQARGQVAEFYKKWFDSLAAVAPQGRAFALYQDLSRAYVLGKTLLDLPDDEKTARRPERVAEQLMLQCL